MKIDSLKPVNKRHNFVKPDRWILFGTVMLTVFGAVFAVSAWSNPTQAPPGGNLSGLLDSSSTAQTKTGALTINGALTASSTLSVSATTTLAITGGNVGIGTTTPNGKLGIDVGTNNADAVYVREGAVTATALGDATGSGVNGILQLFSNGTEKVRLFADPTQNSWISGGNVGIGTVSPLYPLQVSKSSAATAINIIRLENMGAGYGTEGRLLFNSAGTDVGSIGGLVYNGGGLSGALTFSTGVAGSLSEKVRIDSSGNVGIGTTNPGYTLTVAGSAWVTSGAWSGSDVRWKENIQPITGALDKVLQLSGVSYDWRKNEFPENKFDDKTHLGLIAQDVENIIPELVTTGPDGYKGIDYNGLVPLLIGAIQEQQTQIDELTLTDTGDLEIIINDSPEEKSYSLQTAAGEIINRVGAFGKIIAANIKAGLVVARELTSKKITVENLSVKNLELTDQATGEPYCVGIKNGEWFKEKGGCE